MGVTTAASYKFLSPASLEHAEDTEEDHVGLFFGDNPKNRLTLSFNSKALSVISVGSVRDRFRSYLSPASLELAEDAEEDRWSEFLIRPKIQTNTLPLRGELMICRGLKEMSSV